MVNLTQNLAVLTSEKNVEPRQNEAKFQRTREADKFSYYPNGQQHSLNPLKELDELYSKDTKVPLIDLEVFAVDYIKDLEEKNFEKEMKKLQHELDQLELGKFNFKSAEVLFPDGALLSSFKRLSATA
jgi:hypothetical protein